MARSNKLGTGCSILFLLPFILIGTGIFIGLGLWPLWQSQAAKRWIEVPCTVERVELVSSTDSEGDTTYRIEVEYSYRYDGRDHRSERYDFSFGSTNIGVDAMRTAVEDLRQRPTRVCWVDPADPESAVLERETGSIAWFGLIFGAVFAGFPLLIMVFMLRSAATTRRRAALGEQDPLTAQARPRLQTSAVVAAPTDGPTRLAARGSKAGGAIALGIFALIWNGISWLIFLETSDSVARIFIGVFLLIGAGLALGFLHQFLSLFNPVPEFELERGLLRPGSATDLRWTWHGNMRRIVKLEIFLIAREEADYRRGTTTSTDRHELVRELLYESIEAEPVGQARLRIPATALPSLQASNNRIIWAILVKGDIPRFPDVDREFALTVLPPANAAVTVEAPAPDGSCIRLSSGRTAYRPGDTVSGSVRWDLTDARKRLSLRLFWHTAGRGTVDVGVVDEWVLDTPDLHGEQTFDLRLPEFGPVSCAGHLVSVLWALELVAEPGGAIERLALTVGSQGQVLTVT